jgi:hypothetical protein
MKPRLANALALGACALLVACKPPPEASKAKKNTAVSALDSSPQGRCAETLQFDTVVLQKNYAAQLSVLNTITRSNYEQMKTNLGGSLGDILSGNFDQFSEKRSQMQSSFSLDQQVQISENLYQRILSPEGARAYALCIRAHDALVAWASSTGITSNKVAVTVRNNLPGTGTMTYTVAGATPLNQPEELSSGSEQTLIFNSPRNQEFFLVLNGKNVQSNASFSVPPIELPAYVEYQRIPEFQTVSGVGSCAAGCNGSTSGCQIHRPAILNAPMGFTLDPRSLRPGTRTSTSPGINIDPPWTWTKSPEDAPVTMTGQPGQCDSGSAHTQQKADYEWLIQAVRYKTVKVG